MRVGYLKGKKNKKLKGADIVLKILLEGVYSPVMNNSNHIYRGEETRKLEELFETKPGALKKKKRESKCSGNLNNARRIHGYIIRTINIIYRVGLCSALLRGQ